MDAGGLRNDTVVEISTTEKSDFLLRILSLMICVFRLRIEKRFVNCVSFTVFVGNEGPFGSLKSIGERVAIGFLFNSS